MYFVKFDQGDAVYFDTKEALAEAVKEWGDWGDNDFTYDVYEGHRIGTVSYETETTVKIDI